MMDASRKDHGTICFYPASKKKKEEQAAKLTKCNFETRISMTIVCDENVEKKHDFKSSISQLLYPNATTVEHVQLQ
jgi:hypothetical protein